MASSLKAPYDGTDYQARLFWGQALRLFTEDSLVTHVECECPDAKSIDDIAVTYSSPVQDGAGGSVDLDYHQIKFHLNGKPFGHEDLADPAFINAEKTSFLQRLRNAYRTRKSAGKECRFYLTCPSPIKDGDTLHSLIRNDAGGLNVDLLMSKGSRSEIGKVRKNWQDHMSVQSDDEFRAIIKSLRILNGGTLAVQGEVLNLKLQVAGIKPPDPTKLANTFDDLARKIVQVGTTRFDSATLKEFFEREGLWNGGPRPKQKEYLRLGLRSFVAHAESLSEHCNEMLCLHHYFKGRQFLPDARWEDLYKEVVDFVRKFLSKDIPNCFILHTHTSISFAVGYAAAKSGAAICIEQAGLAGDKPSVMEVGVPRSEHKRKDWKMVVNKINPSGHELAMVVSASRSIASDVAAYLKSSNSDVGTLLEFEPVNGPSQRSIIDGNHAGEVAELISTALAENRTQSARGKPVHVFISGPNVLSLATGLQAPIFGQCVLYEFNPTTHTYCESFSFPME